MSIESRPSRDSAHRARARRALPRDGLRYWRPVRADSQASGAQKRRSSARKRQAPGVSREAHLRDAGRRTAPARLRCLGGSALMTPCLALMRHQRRHRTLTARVVRCVAQDLKSRFRRPLRRAPAPARPAARAARCRTSPGVSAATRWRLRSSREVAKRLCAFRIFCPAKKRYLSELTARLDARPLATYSRSSCPDASVAPDTASRKASSCGSPAARSSRGSRHSFSRSRRAPPR